MSDMINDVEFDVELDGEDYDDEFDDSTVTEKQMELIKKLGGEQEITPFSTIKEASDLIEKLLSNKESTSKFEQGKREDRFNDNELSYNQATVTPKQMDYIKRLGGEDQISAHSTIKEASDLIGHLLKNQKKQDVPMATQKQKDYIMILDPSADTDNLNIQQASSLISKLKTEQQADKIEMFV